MVKLKAPQPLVKTTASGKVSVLLTHFIKIELINIFQGLFEQIHSAQGKYRKPKLNEQTADVRIYRELQAEVYKKCHSQLHLQRDTRVALTPAQALALWVMLLDRKEGSATKKLSPPVGNLYMQLHQNLS
jgi:hypothetical protein